MNDREPEAMREIHKIREEMYEEMKNMSTRERVQKIKEEAEACKKEFGLKLPQRVLIRR
jgi:hypothetical protein